MGDTILSQKQFEVIANTGIYIIYLECQQKEKCFNTVKSSVHKISHEQIVGLRNISAHFEQLFQVIELTVYITTNLENEFIQLL